MSMSMSVNANYASSSTMGVSRNNSTAQKPVWNPNKVYTYLEDMDKGFKDYRAQATSYYKSQVSADGNRSMSVDELKAQIEEWFPEYTLTDTEPGKVVQGKFYLYIDKSNLEKMASDADYRARVYGLMDTELQGKKGYTLQYSDGRNVTAHLTGSIFSLSDKNKKYDCGDGIPYLGSCTSDQSVSSSASHPQVRSMSYLYDNIDPAKSAAKARASQASQNAARLAKKQQEKKAEKKAQEKKAEKKAAEKKAAEKAKEKKAAQKELEEARIEKKEIKDTEFDNSVDANANIIESAQATVGMPDDTGWSSGQSVGAWLDIKA